MENNDNTGVLFLNTEKKSEKSPDYSGSITVDGKTIKFSGWRKTSKNGVNYISLAVNKGIAPAPQSKAPVDDFGTDDDIPF